MPRRKPSGAALPAALAAAPLVVGMLRALASARDIWFWGDQALIDIEARNSLLGRNLLGVYDRYGWHHLGPIWLFVLGAFRWLGGGSAIAVVVGYYVLQAFAAAAIVVVASRLRPGLTAWWAALVVVGYEWTFGIERLGMLWAPYAIALPTALLVLLVAEVVSSENPWPATIAAAVCGTFLCQTDVGTTLLVAVLVVATPLLRLAVRLRRRADNPGGTGPLGAGLARAGPGGVAPAGAEAVGATRWSVQAGWGWSAGRWRRNGAALVALVAVLWLPTIIQELTTRTGNLVEVYRFLSAHPSHQAWTKSLTAAGTIFGTFPFGLGEEISKHDATPGWLVSQQVWLRPWFIAYFVVVVAAAARALRRNQRDALALLAASAVGMLAAVVSVHLVYGPLYPYLVLWTGALVVPAWMGVWMAFTRPRSPATGVSPAVFAASTALLVKRATALASVTSALAERTAALAAALAASAAVPADGPVAADVGSTAASEAAGLEDAGLEDASGPAEVLQRAVWAIGTSSASQSAASAPVRAVPDLAESAAAGPDHGAAVVAGSSAGTQKTLAGRAAAWGRRAWLGRAWRARLAVVVASVVASLAVSASFVLTTAPMASGTSSLGQKSWEAVAKVATAPGVKTVYVDFIGAKAMPEAAAIVDQTLRHGRRAEVDKAALYFLDPSFAPRHVAQLTVVVCCGPAATRVPVGLKFRARVGGQAIYTAHGYHVELKWAKVRGQKRGSRVSWQVIAPLR